MVSYATNELIPSSDFAKKFGSYLGQIREHTVEKLAILKNNKVPRRGESHKIAVKLGIKEQKDMD